MMRMAMRCVLGALLVSAAACAVDNTNEPSGDDPVNGIVYSAEVREIISRQNRQFAVFVSLRNVTEGTLTRKYPVGCVVQIRLYRPGGNQRVYDEAQNPCAPADSLVATIAAGQTISLTSGIRFPQNITATIPAAEYRVSAVVHTEPSGFLEVWDGLYRLPLCVPEGSAGLGTVCR